MIKFLSKNKQDTEKSECVESVYIVGGWTIQASKHLNEIPFLSGCSVQEWINFAESTDIQAKYICPKAL